MDLGPSALEMLLDYLLVEMDPDSGFNGSNVYIGDLKRALGLLKRDDPRYEMVQTFIARHAAAKIHLDKLCARAKRSRRVVRRNSLMPSRPQAIASLELFRDMVRLHLYDLSSFLKEYEHGWKMISVELISAVAALRDAISDLKGFNTEILEQVENCCCADCLQGFSRDVICQLLSQLDVPPLPEIRSEEQRITNTIAAQAREVTMPPSEIIPQGCFNLLGVGRDADKATIMQQVMVKMRQQPALMPQLRAAQATLFHPKSRLIAAFLDFPEQAPLPSTAPARLAADGRGSPFDPATFTVREDWQARL